jgi:5,10-methylenetetrahydromethanopterin reductase
MATLYELTQGRVNLGVGVGDSALRNLGKKVASVSSLEESMLNLRRLFGGERVELEGYPVQLTASSGVTIPIYLAAGSPRTQELAGRLADGVIVGYWPDMDKGMARVRDGERKAMRAQGQVKVVLWTPCSISDDAREALDAVKPQVARRLLSAAARGVLSPDEMAAVERLRREYNFRHHMGPEHSSLVPDELVDRYAVAGTAIQVREKVRSILSIQGIHEIAIIPWGKDREWVVRAFAQNVINSLRG